MKSIKNEDILKALLLCSSDSNFYQIAHREFNERSTIEMRELSKNIIYEDKARDLKKNSSLTSDMVFNALPNLLLCSDLERADLCSAYQKLEKYFLGSKRHLHLTDHDVKIVSNLHHAIAQDSLADHQLSFVLSLLFQSYYGERGNLLLEDIGCTTEQREAEKRLNDINHSIEKYMDSHEGDIFSVVLNQTCLQQIRPGLLKLHQLLHSDSREKRMMGRNICETYRVPISLDLMLSLSIDGLQQEQEHESGGVLVVGNSGAGKSTFINYSNGTRYKRKMTLGTREPYLEYILESDSALPRARVGHGYISRTLYAQMYGKYIDTPGFNDTRCHPEGTCASIGPALAAHSVEKLSSVIIVIPWDATSSAAVGRGYFREICLTLEDLVGGLDALMHSEPSPVIFVFTKPDVSILGPGETFDDFRDILAERVKKYMQDNHTRFTSDQERFKSERKVLEKEFMSAKKARAVLTNLSGFRKDGRMVEKALEFSGSTEWADDLAAGRIGRKVDNDIEESSRGIGGELLHKDKVLLKQQLTSLYSCQTRHAFENDLAKLNAGWEEKEKKLWDKCDSIRVNLETIEGEKKILTLLGQESEFAPRTFFISGHDYINADQALAYDHKNELLEYIRQLELEGTESSIPKDNFLFSASDEKYKDIVTWLDTKTVDYASMIASFNKALDDIKELDQEIANDQAQITENMRSFKRILMDRDDADIATIKEEKIRDLKLLIESKEDEIAKLNDKIRQCQRKIGEEERYIAAVKSEPLYDYHTVIKRKEKIYWWNWMFSRWVYDYPDSRRDMPTNSFTKMTYNLFGYEQKTAIPIEKVILSSLVNSEGKVVFNRAVPFGPGVDMSKIVEREDIELTDVRDSAGNVIQGIQKLIPRDTANAELNQTGRFEIGSTLSLRNGSLSVTYLPDGWEMSAGIRVMVKPEMVPQNALQIKICQRGIRSILSKIEKDKLRIEEINREIIESHEDIQLIGGGFVGQEKIKERLFKVWDQTGSPITRYLEDTLKVFTDEMRQWLCDKKNTDVLLALRSASEEQIKILFPDLNVTSYKRVISEESILPSGSHPILSNQTLNSIAGRIGSDIFKHLENMSKTLGLCVQSVICIVQRLNAIREGVPNEGTPNLLNAPIYYGTRLHAMMPRVSVPPVTSSLFDQLSQKLLKLNLWQYYFNESLRIIRERQPGMQTAYHVQSIFKDSESMPQIKFFAEVYAIFIKNQSQEEVLSTADFFEKVLSRHKISDIPGKTSFDQEEVHTKLRDGEESEFGSMLGLEASEIEDIHWHWCESKGGDSDQQSVEETTDRPSGMARNSVFANNDLEAKGEPSEASNVEDNTCNFMAGRK